MSVKRSYWMSETETFLRNYKNYMYRIPLVVIGPYNFLSNEAPSSICLSTMSQFPFYHPPSRWFNSPSILSSHIPEILFTFPLKFPRCLHAPVMLFSSSFCRNRICCFKLCFHLWGNCPAFISIYEVQNFSSILTKYSLLWRY